MKLNKLFMGLLGVLAMTACSSDDIVPEQKPLPVEGESEPRYMSVTIRNSNGGLTRAEGDGLTDKDFEDGLTDENEVHSLRFYFFDAQGAPIAVSTGNLGRSYYDCLKEDITSPSTGTTQPDPDFTVEKVLNAVIVINSTDKNIAQKLKYMAAIANYKNPTTKAVVNEALNDNLSLEQFQQLVFTKDQIDSAEGFMLTSSSFVEEQKQEDGSFVKKAVFAVEVKDTDVKGSKEEAQNSPVDIYVERVVAKMRVRTAWADDFVGKNGIVKNIKFDTEGAKRYGNGTFDAIPLYSYKKNDKNEIENKPITVDQKNEDGVTVDTKQIYVVFTGWNIWSTANMSYVIKKVDAGWNQVIGDWWNTATYHRSYWAQNPTQYNEGTPFKLENYPHTHANKKVLTGESYKDTNREEYNSYCLENAADSVVSGYKRFYDPNKTVTNRTLAYVGGVLVTVDGTTASELELVEWAAYKDTEDNMLKRMFASIENVYYFMKKGTSVTTETVEDNKTIINVTTSADMVPFEAKDVKFVTGLELNDDKLVNNDSENSPRYRSYLQLNFTEIPNDYEQKVYRRITDGKYEEVTGGLATVNKNLTELGGAKFWENGKTYYYLDVQHLNTADDAVGRKGKYGVVRNHLYEVQLNSVFGLGTPVLNPKHDKIEGEEEWEIIIPQHPDYEFYLGARLNILSWRIVNNNVSFDW